MMKRMARAKRRRSLFLSGLVYLGVALFVIFSLFPILWMVSTSLKPGDEVYTVPPQLITENSSISNYLRVLRDKEIIGYFVNSLIIGGLTTIFSLIIAIIGAYGFARFKFPGRNFLALAMLVTQMLPAVALMVPFYILITRIRLFDTHSGLILVYFVTILPLSVWLLRSFFQNIPKELEDTARIDGCSGLGVLFRVVLPISLPAVFGVLLYAFLTAWNEFIYALVLTGKSSRTISVGLAWFQQEMAIDWGGMMSTATLMVIPVIITIVAFEKYLVKGLTEGALKG